MITRWRLDSSQILSVIFMKMRKEVPCILVVPGGGYCVVSPTEGEMVALEFYKKGI